MSIIASCAQDIKFHDWETDTCHGVCKLEKPARPGGGFVDISWSCDGAQLAAVQGGGKATLMRPHLQPTYHHETFVNECDHILSVGAVRCAQFSRTQGTLLAVGTGACRLLLYHTASRYSTMLVDDLPAPPLCVSYAADDQYVAVACANGQIFVAQGGAGISESYFVPGSERVTALATHPAAARYMAGGSERGVIAVWDVSASSALMQTAARGAPVADIAFSPADRTLTALSGDHAIGIYDLRADECVHEKLFDTRLTTLAYSPRSMEVAVGTEQGLILRMDQRYLRSYRPGMKAHDGAVTKVKFQRAHAHEPRWRLPAEAAEGRVGDHLDDAYAAASNSSSSSREAPPPPPPAAGEAASLFHIIDERSLHHFKQNVLSSTQEMIERIIDQVNNHFLKLRMNVSREFCNMELHNRNRWQEFNDTLMKIACLDDRRQEAQARHQEQRASTRATLNGGEGEPEGECELDAPSEGASIDSNYSDQLLDPREIELSEIAYRLEEPAPTRPPPARVAMSQAGGGGGGGYVPAIPSIPESRDSACSQASKQSRRYGSGRLAQQASRERKYQ